MMNLPVENTTTSGLNFTEAAEATANPEVTMNELPCGYLDIEKFNTIQSCSFWVEGVSMSILGIGAIITNAISIYVFTRKEMWNSFSALIVALTVVDSVLCILLMADYTFARAFELHTVMYTILYPYFTYPITNISLSASIYMTVVLGLERYIAVCFPLVHRDLVHTYSVSQRVMWYTIPVMVLSVLINIPKFLETRIVVETAAAKSETDLNETSASATSEAASMMNMTTYTIDVTELRDNPIYIKYYMNITRTVLLGILPFAALIFFNIKIYQRFIVTRRRYTRNNNNSSQQAKDLQLAMILVVIVCMFFVTNLPRLLLNLYELYNVNEMIACKDFYPPTWFICSTSVNHLLLVLNCVMNFVVYCCFNDGFKAVICGRAITSNINAPASSNGGHNGYNHSANHRRSNSGGSSKGKDPSPEREARTALLTNGGVHEMVVIKTETAMPVTGISSDTTNTSATTTTSAV